MPRCPHLGPCLKHFKYDICVRSHCITFLRSPFLHEYFLLDSPYNNILDNICFILLQKTDDPADMARECNDLVAVDDQTFWFWTNEGELWARNGILVLTGMHTNFLLLTMRDSANNQLLSHLFQNTLCDHILHEYSCDASRRCLWSWGYQWKNQRRC
jgi:hypothetical protein